MDAAPLELGPKHVASEIAEAEKMTVGLVEDHLKGSRNEFALQPIWNFS